MTTSEVRVDVAPEVITDTVRTIAKALQGDAKKHKEYHVHRQLAVIYSFMRLFEECLLREGITEDSLEQIKSTSLAQIYQWISLEAKG